MRHIKQRLTRPVEVGDRYGMLTVVALHTPSRRITNRKWLCKCDCGNERAVTEGSLIYHGTKSCGCEKARKGGERFYRHGGTHTKLYRVWVGMKSRCENPNDKKYRIYGGRGITVCERWHKFENFLADMGQPPEGLTLDRIDGDGNYEPGNCRWASYLTQARNTKKAIKVEYEGRVVSVSELAERFGVPRQRVYLRLKKGWPIDRALFTKAYNGGNHHV